MRKNVIKRALFGREMVAITVHIPTEAKSSLVEIAGARSFGFVLEDMLTDPKIKKYMRAKRRQQRAAAMRGEAAGQPSSTT